jgi:hypothetical protein
MTDGRDDADIVVADTDDDDGADDDDDNDDDDDGADTDAAVDNRESALKLLLARTRMDTVGAALAAAAVVWELASAVAAVMGSVGDGDDSHSGCTTRHPSLLAAAAIAAKVTSAQPSRREWLMVLEFREKIAI